MPRHLLILFLVADAVLQTAVALPLSTPPVEDSPPPIFALWLCIPFFTLAAAKIAYMKFRRAQSIHACDPGGSIEIAIKSPAIPSLRGIGFQLQEPKRRGWFWRKDFTGYFVGFLGSPEWETRIRKRVDRAVRRSALGSLSTSPRISIVNPYSSVSGNTPISQGTNNPSHTATIASSDRKSRRSSSHRRSDSHRSRSVSVSFLEMTTPKIPAPDMPEFGTVLLLPASCPETSHHPGSTSRATEDSRWRRRRLNITYFSPVSLLPADPQTSVPPPKLSLDKSIKTSSEESRTRSSSKSTLCDITRYLGV